MRLSFEFFTAVQAGVPLALVLLGILGWRMSRQGLSRRVVAALLGARAVVFGILIFLAARPVWSRVESEENRRSVVLLCDRSQSMSLAEESGTRYAQMLRLLSEELGPALNQAQLKVEPYLFAKDAEPATAEGLAKAKPDGERSDLGGAIVRGLSSTGEPPLAVIALSDGVANASENNGAAIASLLEKSVPFIGIGIGQDSEVNSLSLRNVTAPDFVAPKQSFRISAQIQAVTAGELPGCELLLMRDGKLSQTRRLAATKGSRSWSETFVLSEELEGVHSYTVTLGMPVDSEIKCAKRSATVSVRIAKEGEMRILFVQGQLTWDFKFIGRALGGDPSLEVTGLSRTSEKSFFRQNVEGSEELAEGFPTSLEQLAPYRVLVVSSLKASDLTVAQQELIARYCSELGGGVLLLGGPASFDGSWQGSRLEQLLPVTFDSSRGVQGLDKPFKLALSEAALQSAVFQMGDGTDAARAWGQLPAFTQYGRVLEAKPAAVVWARHPDDEGPQGKRILMASQRYGAGLAAVICIENFWRWRLAKESNVQHFDRFWQQLFRYLGQAGRESITLYFPDSEPRLNSDVQLVIERQQDQESIKLPEAGAANYRVKVSDPKGRVLLEQRTELQPERPLKLSFRAELPGLYTAEVSSAAGVQICARTLELKDYDVELERTARAMDNLEQWAGLSHGFAVRLEDCPSGEELLKRINQTIASAKAARRLTTPAGINGWVLAALLFCLCGEWALRRRLGLR